MFAAKSESEHEVLPAISAGPGTIFRFYVDHSKAEDDIDSRHLKVIYDGKPASPPFRVPPHWHTDHNEHWTMLEGRMIATIGCNDIEMRVGERPVIVPAGVVHCFRSIPGVRAVLKEQSSPPGPWKALNMRDIFQLGRRPTFLLSMRANWDSATYLHFGGPLIIDRLMMYILGPFAKILAPGKQHDGPTRAPRRGEKMS